LEKITTSEQNYEAFYWKKLPHLNKIMRPSIGQKLPPLNKIMRLSIGKRLPPLNKKLPKL
jgi:hypothetical protein